jgi:hypothetical protein
MQVCHSVETQVDEVITETFDRVTTRIDEVCEDLPWPLDWFCHAVTTVIKWVETVVRTVTRTIIKVVCTPVETALNAIGDVVNTLLEIPILGAFIRWVRGAMVYAISQVGGLADTAAGLIGIRPIKTLTLHVIVLMKEDGSLLAKAADVDSCLRNTDHIYRDRAEIRIRSSVHNVSEPSPSNALYVDSDTGFFGEDATGAGMYFQQMMTELVGEGSSRATGLWAPVVAFIVEGVGDKDTKGCSGGPLADYVVVEPEVVNGTDNTLAHEVGHALGLLHDNILFGESKGDRTNLMFWATSKRNPRGDNLSPFQRGLVRASPHVSYL